MKAEVYIHPLAYEDLAGIFRLIAQANREKAMALLESLSLLLVSPGLLIKRAVPMQEDDDLMRLGYRYVALEACTLYFRENEEENILIQRVMPGRRIREYMLR